MLLTLLAHNSPSQPDRSDDMRGLIQLAHQCDMGRKKCFHYVTRVDHVSFHVLGNSWLSGLPGFGDVLRLNCMIGEAVPRAKTYTNT